ncbi:MAG: SRPBCC family protein [Thermoleophilaceae bacterium]|nr:SRPBCC family protein [Thermoleophilaceae bacterium]
MRLEESFEVDAPVEDVWRALIDVQRVAPCLPGAEITEVGEDGTYRGNFQVKVGPTTAAYRGTLKLESLDEAAHVATMSANGQDKRGQGSAKATMVSTVTGGEGGGTRVHVDTDFTITGRLARFGRGGMIQDISKRLLGDFAACLQEELKGSVGVDRTEQAGDARLLVSEPEQPVGEGPIASARANRPVRGLALLLSVLRDRIRRFMSRRRGG